MEFVVHGYRRFKLVDEKTGEVRSGASLHVANPLTGDGRGIETIRMTAPEEVAAYLDRLDLPAPVDLLISQTVKRDAAGRGLIALRVVGLAS